MKPDKTSRVGEDFRWGIRPVGRTTPFRQEDQASRILLGFVDREIDIIRVHIRASVRPVRQ